MVRCNIAYLRLVTIWVLEVWIGATAVDIGLIAIATIQLTKYTLTHIRVGNDVDRLEALTIIHTRELCIIREFIEDLDAVYSLCGERVERCRYILAEELLAIDEDLLYLLTLRLNLTVRDGDAWHLLQESLNIGICSHLKCRSIVG